MLVPYPLSFVFLGNKQTEIIEISSQKQKCLGWIFILQIKTLLNAEFEHARIDSICIPRYQYLNRGTTLPKTYIIIHL